MSLCFRDPFLQHKLQDIDESLNITTYLRYLKGEIFEDVYNRIDYNNVTLNLDDYFSYMTVVLRNKASPKNNSIALNNKVKFNGFLFEKFVKCFELISDMEIQRDIEQLYFFYNVTKLRLDWGQYGTLLGNGYKIYFKIYYPGQFLLSDMPTLIGYDLFEEKHAGEFRVILSDLEIIQRRPTQKKVCYKDTKDYDATILKGHIKESGCRNPYHEDDDTFPICDTKEKMEASKFEYTSAKNLEIPEACQRIIKMRQFVPLILSVLSLHLKSRMV